MDTLPERSTSASIADRSASSTRSLNIFNEEEHEEHLPAPESAQLYDNIVGANLQQEEQEEGDDILSPSDVSSEEDP